jgi:membrane protein
MAIVISGAVFGQQQAQDRIVAQIAGLIGVPGAVAVNRLIESAKLPANAGPAVTLTGAGALLLGGLGAFAQLQDAFDTIWGVTPRHGGLMHILRARLVAFVMAVAVAFLLLASLIVQTVLASVRDYAVSQHLDVPLMSAAVNVILPLVVATGLFAVMFKFLPQVQLSWQDIWPGAILTAVLFTVGKNVISLYLGRTAVSSATGAAGSLLIVLIWVYYSSLILLFGAEFTQIYVRCYRRHRAQPNPDTVPVTAEAQAREGQRPTAGAPLSSGSR